MSIFHKEIFELTIKKTLSLKDKNTIKGIKTRFSLEHFHWHRFYKKKGLHFDDIIYSRLNYFDLLQSCFEDL